MPDNELLARLARFEKQFFPRYEKTFPRLVEEATAEGRHLREWLELAREAAPPEIDSGHGARCDCIC